MKNKFYCQKCQAIFEAEGKKVEYQDPIYGHCWKRVANCPACGAECSEHTPKGSQSKKNVDFDNYVNDLRNRGGGGCCGGSGCCG